MKVFKFGGASVKDAAAIKNVASIITAELDRNKSREGINTLLVVVSAIGSTTDALLDIIQRKKNGDGTTVALNDLKRNHVNVMRELFENNSPVFAVVDSLFNEMDVKLLLPEDEYEVLSDDLVSYGESLSSRILSAYLESLKVTSTWRDAREIVRTDDEFGRANVTWELVDIKAHEFQTRWLIDGVVVTQGFIGVSPDGYTTTLGREGSDFSGAIFASAFNAESLTLWKDVPGLMNADPRIIPTAEVLEEISYQDAAEIMYHGANLIHIKTIQPLAAKEIPLHVKCFIDPALWGTRIRNSRVQITTPLIVVKENQVSVMIKLPGLAFLTELHLQELYMILANHVIRPVLVKHSPFSLTLGFDYDHDTFLAVVKRISESYEVYYRTDLTLVTVKNFSKDLPASYRALGKVHVEQTSGSVLQLLIEDVDLSLLKPKEVKEEAIKQAVTA